MSDTAKHVLVAGSMTVQPADRAAALELLSMVAVATREEPGCELYRISADIDEPNRFRIIEEWATQAQLDAHMQTPHVGKFVAGVARMSGVRLEVDRYGISSKRRLM